MSSTRVTEAEWREVFQLRCQSKRGHRLSAEELSLCERAMKQDRKRYVAMDDEIFEKTAPFGASLRSK